jgi:hypothetical protein
MLEPPFLHAASKLHKITKMHWVRLGIPLTSSQRTLPSPITKVSNMSNSSFTWIIGWHTRLDKKPMLGTLLPEKNHKTKRTVHGMQNLNLINILSSRIPDPNIASLTGKEVLKGLVCSAQEEYNELSMQDHKKLVHEFEEHKATQTKVFHVSTKSHINNTTHTLAAIENEVVSIFSLQLPHQCLMFCV